MDTKDAGSIGGLKTSTLYKASGHYQNLQKKSVEARKRNKLAKQKQA